MTNRPSIMCFTGLAQAYAQHRPTYPAGAIDFILEGLSPPIYAADIGCGTGISARLLAERGVIVTAIDPNPEMLEEAKAIRTQTPIEFIIGEAENLPLPEASFDLVLCAQSFHWFDPHKTLRELQRITKPTPSSRVALMWNLRDDADPVTTGYNEVVRLSQEDATRRGLVVNPERAGDITLGGFFTTPRTQSFPNPQSLDENALLGRIRSASYFPKSGPLRDELEAKLRGLFELHHQNGCVTLMHRTEVTIAHRSPAEPAQDK